MDLSMRVEQMEPALENRVRMTEAYGLEGDETENHGTYPCESSFGIQMWRGSNQDGV